MKNQSLKKNFIFQFFYQFIILVIPLIISPYLTRTLQETSLGIYTYVNSIAYYFIVLANLGINIHGKRLISYVIEDEFILRKSFWSLYVVHILISLIILVLYLGFIIVFVKNNKFIYYITLFYVSSTIFDINWLFYGLEDFGSIIIRNTLIKIITCILIFLFIKTERDIWIYTLINSVGVLVGNLLMLPKAIKLIKPIMITIEDMKEHIKPLLVFSISIIASTLYTVFDKTLLGIMINKESVAFYEYANQIIMVPQTFVGIIGTVMFPRACRLVAQKKIKEQKQNMEISLMITAFIGIGSIFGLLLVAKEFSILYYGKNFAVTGNIMLALSPLIYIIGTGSVIRTQYLIPNRLDKEFNICILYNAIINLILTWILIPIIGVYGAVVGTIVAEIFGFVYQVCLSRKLIKINLFINTAFPFIVNGSLMFIFSKIIYDKMEKGIISLVIIIIMGGSIYCFLAIIYLFFFKKKLLEKLKYIKLINKKENE